MEDSSVPEVPETPESPPDKEQLARLVNAGMRTYWITIIAQGVVILCLVGAVVYLLVGQAGATQNTQNEITQAVQKDDQRWCSTMDLLTRNPVAKPANPSANPSREASYEAFIDFSTLKKEFGCEK